MNYKKKTKIAALITVVLTVAITGSAFAFGAQHGNFAFWKTSVISVEFPHNKASDISAGYITDLILNATKHTGSEIYLTNSPQNINYNTDWTLRDLTSEVLISDYQNGLNVYKRYQIRIFPDSQKMNIFPYDSLLPADTEQRYCTFDAYWNALTWLPTEELKKMPKGVREIGGPEFYSLTYTPHDHYLSSSPAIYHIFYNENGVINDYRPSPAVMFDFWSMVQDEYQPNAYTGVGYTILYYYADRETKIDSVAVDESFNISLANLRELAAKGDELTISDFKDYEGQDVGSSPYVMHYSIEGGYYLLLRSPGEGTPWYIRLHIPGAEEYIDIRHEDIDKFIRKYPVPSEIKPHSEWLEGMLQSAASDVERWSRGFTPSDNPAGLHTYEIRASLHEIMPEYRFVATGIINGIDEWAYGYVLGLNIYDNKNMLIHSADFSEVQDGETVGYYIYNQMMDTMGLHVVDVNFDGYKDVIILNTFAGAHGNTWYDCWLWDAKTSSFIFSKSFTDICNPALDSEKECIYSAGGSGAAYWGGNIYKFIDGEFVLTNELETNWEGLVERELINGEMQVVREVSYGDVGQVVEAEQEYYKNNELWKLDNPRWYWAGGHHADQWLGE